MPTSRVDEMTGRDDELSSNGPKAGSWQDARLRIEDGGHPGVAAYAVTEHHRSGDAHVS